jgi:hypothetical protein
MKPLGHGHTKIADQVWQNILWPWLDAQRRGYQPEPPAPGEPPPPGVPGRPPSESPWLDVASVAFGAAVGFLLVKLVTRWT